MDMTFTDTPVTSATTGLRPVTSYRADILTHLSQAVQRATTDKHDILASITIPITLCDPLRVFHAFKHIDLGNRFFWHRPAEQRALVGVGEAITISTAGADAIKAAAATRRELHHHTMVRVLSKDLPAHINGPVFFGGFAFDPLNPHTNLWQGFPDGLLIVPTLLFQYDKEHAALTISAFISSDTDVEQRTREIEQHLQRLVETIQLAVVQAQEEELDTIRELSSHDLLPPESWKSQVAEAVRRIRQGDLEKVVLARAVQVSTEQPFVLEETLQRLRQSYPKAYVFAVQRGKRYFVGATPERLISSKNGRIQTMALAGSAPRGATEEEDRRIEQELLNSQKNKEEHRVVADMIRNALASFCSHVWVADAPHLLKLKNIQHLETPIMGDLLPGRCILEAIEKLHPTPAVGGNPRPIALETIREIEDLDRGWYASPIGWVDINGNGEFAVALRSSLVEANSATLFAGCGIVADSDPESEYQESCWKLQVMLRGLGGEH